MPLLLLFVWPFLAFLISVRKLDQKVWQIVFVLFCGLFGYCQDFSLTTSDCYRIALQFQSFDMEDIFRRYAEGQSPDLYMNLLYSLLRALTSNPKVLFAVVGLIFGYLYCQCISIVYIHLKCRNKWFWIIALSLLCNISLIEIMGGRFYTGALLFVLSAYKWCYLKKKTWIVGIALTPFVHFGHIFSVILLLGGGLAFRFCRFLSPSWLFRMVFFAFLLSFLPISEYFNQILSHFAGDSSGMIEYKLTVYSGSEENMGIADDAQTVYRQANILFFAIFQGLYKICLCCLCRYLSKNVRVKTRLYTFVRLVLVYTIGAYLASAIGIAGTGFRYVTVAGELLIIAMAIGLSQGYTFRPRTLYLVPTMCFVQIAFLLFNAPRVVGGEFWLLNLPVLVYDGLGFYLHGMLTD